MDFDLPELTAMRREFGPHLDFQVDRNLTDVKSLSEIVDKMKEVKKKYTGGHISKSSFKGYDAVYFWWDGTTVEAGSLRLPQSQCLYVLNILIDKDWYMISYGGDSADFAHHLEQAFLSMGSLTPDEQLGLPHDKRPSEPEILFHAAIVALNFRHFNTASVFRERGLEQSPDDPNLLALNSYFVDLLQQGRVFSVSELPKWENTD